MANAYYADHHNQASKTMMRDPIKHGPKTTLINTQETSLGNTYFRMSKNNSFAELEEKADSSPVVVKIGKHTKLAKLQTKSIIAGK